MLKAVRSLGTGARGSSGDVMWMSGGGGSGCCSTGMSGCEMCWSPRGPWVPANLCKEGGNLDAAAVIAELISMTGKENTGRNRPQCEVGHLCHEASANHGSDTRLQLDTDPSKHAAWEETVSGERDKTTALHQGA